MNNLQPRHKRIETLGDRLNAINKKEKDYIDRETSYIDEQRPMYGQLVVVKNEAYDKYATDPDNKSALLLSNAANCTLGWITTKKIQDIDDEDGRVIDSTIVKAVFLFNTHDTVVYDEAIHLIPGVQITMHDHVLLEKTRVYDKNKHNGCLVKFESNDNVMNQTKDYFGNETEEYFGIIYEPTFGKTKIRVLGGAESGFFYNSEVHKNIEILTPRSVMEIIHSLKFQIELIEIAEKGRGTNTANIPMPKPRRGRGRGGKPKNSNSRKTNKKIKTRRRPTRRTRLSA